MAECEPDKNLAPYAAYEQQIVGNKCFIKKAQQQVENIK
jgi:hypothetical protein